EELARIGQDVIPPGGSDDAVPLDLRDAGLLLFGQQNQPLFDAQYIGLLKLVFPFVHISIGNALAEVGAEFQQTIGLLSDNDTHPFRLHCLQILETRQVESQWSDGRVLSGPGFLELSNESDVVRLCASMLRNRSVVLERFKDIEFSSRQ